MSATLQRDKLSFDDWSAPPGIVLRRPRLAMDADAPMPVGATGTEPSTQVHPVGVATAVASYAWFLLVCWVVFVGSPEMPLTLSIATLISVIMLGALLACGHGARNVTPWQREWRSFGEFLAGDVEVWGGRMKGREAFAEVAGLSGALALGVTLLGVIIALSRP